MRAVKLRVIRPDDVVLPWHQRPAVRRTCVVLRWLLIGVTILTVLVVIAAVLNVLLGLLLILVFSRFVGGPPR